MRLRRCFTARCGWKFEICCKEYTSASLQQYDLKQWRSAGTRSPNLLRHLNRSLKQWYNTHPMCISHLCARIKVFLEFYQPENRLLALWMGDSTGEQRVSRSWQHEHLWFSDLILINHLYLFQISSSTKNTLHKQVGFL